MTDSQTLLRQYAQSGSESAFRELVGRHLNFVYSTAVRLVGGDCHLAEDVTQTVFIHLAQNAHRPPNDVMLGGWLHRDTCNIASKMMRGQRRRQARERQAAQMNAVQKLRVLPNRAQTTDDCVPTPQMLSMAHS